jgi:DnaJ family protein C protein 8
MRVLEYAREAIREERRKATKHDAGIRVAAQMHPEGREGVEREWEATDEFHEKWKIKAREVLAKTEFRRRKLSKRYGAFIAREFSCFRIHDLLLRIFA